MAAVTSLASTTASATPQPTSWWLKDPLDPSRNDAINVFGWSPSQTRPVAEFQPIGRTRAVVLRGPVLGEKGTLSVRTLRKADSDTLRTLLNSQTTLLLQNVLGEQWYVEVSGDVTRTQMRAESEDGTYPVRHFYEWQIPLTEVDAP